jgi:hypothetical protein
MPETHIALIQDTVLIEQRAGSIQGDDVVLVDEAERVCVISKRFWFFGSMDLSLQKNNPPANLL